MTKKITGLKHMHPTMRGSAHALLNPLLTDDLVLHALKTNRAVQSLKWHVERSAVFDRISELIKKSRETPFLSRQYEVSGIYFYSLRGVDDATVDLTLSVELIEHTSLEQVDTLVEMVSIKLPAKLLSDFKVGDYAAWYQETYANYHAQKKAADLAMLKRLVKNYPTDAATYVNAAHRRIYGKTNDKD